MLITYAINYKFDVLNLGSRSPESKREIERAAGVSLNEFVEQCTSFAPKLRMIFEQNNFPIVNTDDKMPEEVAKLVANHILL